jgi:hypothetical protein
VTQPERRRACRSSRWPTSTSATATRWRCTMCRSRWTRVRSSESSGRTARARQPQWSRSLACDGRTAAGSRCSASIRSVYTFTTNYYIGFGKRGYIHTGKSTTGGPLLARVEQHRDTAYVRNPSGTLIDSSSWSSSGSYTYCCRARLRARAALARAPSAWGDCGQLVGPAVGNLKSARVPRFHVVDSHRSGGPIGDCDFCRCVDSDRYAASLLSHAAANRGAPPHHGCPNPPKLRELP